MYSKKPLPKVIILYGPPGSGKNTQGELLAKDHPEYVIVDYGSELRQFVETYKNNPGVDDSSDLVQLANKIDSHISQGVVVDIEDLMYIISSKIMKLLDAGQSVILIGPGRMLSDTQWLAQHLAQNNIESCVLHLHLSLDDIIARLHNRYFVQGSNVPYPSLEEAKINAPSGTEPYRRSDDLDADRIVKRYRSQYKNKFSAILFEFQLHAGSHVFLIDASQSIKKVYHDITSILNRYYHPPQ